MTRIPPGTRIKILGTSLDGQLGTIVVSKDKQVLNGIPYYRISLDKPFPVGERALLFVGRSEREIEVV